MPKDVGAIGDTSDAAWDGSAANPSVVALLKKAATAGSSSPTKGTPTETAVTGSGSGTLIAAAARLSARATLISGSAWVSLTNPAPTAAPARLLNAGDVLYDDQTTAAWYYTAVGGTATFAVVVIA